MEWEKETVCPKCRRLMTPLARYEPMPLDTMPGVGNIDARDVAWVEILALQLALQWLMNGIGYFLWRWKRWKVRRLQQRRLPSFPHTLVCSKCLTILPRR